MSSISNESQFNCLETCGKALKNAGTFAGGVILTAVFVVAHPIIGPLGSIGFLFKAAYHGVLLNYHWRHSRENNEKGNLIPGTELNQMGAGNEKNYMNKHAKFNSHDLSRLQHEVQRLYHLKAAEDSLKWSRGLAKCIIPILGPIWALSSEINTGGSIEFRCCCIDDWHHLTPEEMLEKHISKLTKQDV